MTGLLLGEAIDLPNRVSDEALRTKAFGWSTLGGLALGLASGVLAAHYVEISRSHMAFIDAGGLIGLVLGAGIGYAGGEDAATDSAGTLCGHGSRCSNAARFGLGGLAIGIAAGALITWRFRARLPPQEALLHYDEENGWRLALSVPKVQFSVANAAEGGDRRVVLELARGTF